VRLSLMGLTSGCIVFLGYGLATHGWMMYVLILCNLLSFAVGPALQGIVSKSTPPGEQGELMGSLQSISSVGTFIMPYLGNSVILEWAATLPANDWRIGTTFFLSAGTQLLAILVARHYFRAHHLQPKPL